MDTGGEGGRWPGERPETKTHHVGVLVLIDNQHVVEIEVEVLVDALEDAADLDVVFELDRDLVVDERLEEAAGGGWRVRVRVRVRVGGELEGSWGMGMKGKGGGGGGGFVKKSNPPFSPQTWFRPPEMQRMASRRG
jgi:hypothetical protein